eukprot:7855102-Heterocapsa_arctica.AAC.1
MIASAISPARRCRRNPTTCPETRSLRSVGEHYTSSLHPSGVMCEVFDETTQGMTLPLRVLVVALQEVAQHAALDVDRVLVNLEGPP